MSIKADEEVEEEEVPQDTTTTTDKLGDEIEAVVPSSSTLRASSLLKDNVFTKQDGDGAEDFLEVAGCPGPLSNQNDDSCTLNCSGCPNGKTHCTVFNSCDGADFCITESYTYKCCRSNGSGCNSASTQADASLLKVE